MIKIGSEIGSILEIGSAIKNWQCLFYGQLADLPYFLTLNLGFKSRHSDGLTCEISIISHVFYFKYCFLAVMPAVVAATMRLRDLRRKIKEKMATANFPHIPCRLVDYGGDTSRQWYVVFYIWNKDKKQKERKRPSFEINKDNIRSARYARASLIMSEIDAELEDGGYVDDKPVEKEKMQEQSNVEIDFNNFTLLQGIDLVIKFKQASGLVPGSIRTYTGIKSNLIEWLKLQENEGVNLKGIDREFLMKFFDYLTTVKKHAGKTYNNYKGALYSVFDYFTERHAKHFPVNPCHKIKNRKTSSGKNTAYTPAEVAMIKKEIVHRQEFGLLLFIQFIFYMFFRPREELRYLKIGDIRKDHIYIRPEIAKNDRGAYVMIPKSMEAIIRKHKLREYPRDFYIFGRNEAPGPEQVAQNRFYNKHRKILIHVGITYGDYTTYSYKHTGNIVLYRSTKDLVLCQEQNRHGSVDQTRDYMKDIGAFMENKEMDKFKGI